MSKVQNDLLSSPIAQWLGASRHEGDVFYLQFHERHIGNPSIRAIHGGVVASFLEVIAQCVMAETAEGDYTPQAVNADIDYLRSTRAEDMYGRAEIARHGRRIAFIEAKAWQQCEATPVATARFRLRTPG